MAHQGATLQTFNNELVQCLEDLRDKRNTLNNYILGEEKKKNDIISRMELLKDELNKIDDILKNKKNDLNNYDRTIQDTEDAYNKILSSYFFRMS